MRCIGMCVHMISILMIAAVMAGCAASRDMNRIVQTAGDFTLERIVRQGAGVECASIDDVSANVISEYHPGSCMVAEYARGNSAYQAEFISFGGDYQAAGAFSALRPGNAERIGIGHEGLRAGDMVRFVKGNYLVTVTPQRNAGAGDAADLARQLSSRISGGLGLGPYKAMVAENLVEDSRLYFVGPLGLGTRYPRNLVETLMVSRDVDGIAAKYQVNTWLVDFIEVHYPDHLTAREALNSYLRSFSGGPLVYPDEMLQYYTIVVPGRSEVYVAQYDNRVYLMFGNPPGGQTKQFFEYILRSANETTPNT